MPNQLPQPQLQLDEQTLIGNANALGVMDRGGDVLAPGAFAEALPGFLTHGFIGLAHDWDALPIAMPLEASETEGCLRVVGRFHSTPAAQAARTVLLERLAAGLRVGLSVGFRVGEAEAFPSGVALWDAVNSAPEGYAASIQTWKGPCRLVRKVAELFEVSVVSVPMNPGSFVLAVKHPTPKQPEQPELLAQLRQAALRNQVDLTRALIRTRIQTPHS